MKEILEVLEKIKEHQMNKVQLAKSTEPYKLAEKAINLISNLDGIILSDKGINIARRISMVRQAKGLTIEQVSKKIGKSTYDRVETGKIEPKFSELMKICEVLNIEIWELTAKELVIKYHE